MSIYDVLLRLDLRAYGRIGFTNTYIGILQPPVCMDMPRVDLALSLSEARQGEEIMNDCI